MPNNSLLSDEILELQRKKKRDEAFYKHEAEHKASTAKWNKMMYWTEDSYYTPDTQNECYRFYTSQETF
jgi:hypothetical protein